MTMTIKLTEAEVRQAIVAAVLERFGLPVKANDITWDIRVPLDDNPQLSGAIVNVA